jgi:type II secretory pathway pseudopilin PulG
MAAMHNSALNLFSLKTDPVVLRTSHEVANMSIAEPSRQDGFTVLEALIAMTLLAALAVTLLSAVRGVITADARTRQLVQQREHHSSADDTMRDVLLQAHRLPRTSSDLSFEGSPGYLRVVTRPHGSSAPQYASIEIEGETLVLELSPLQGERHWPTPIVLADALSEARFYYFGESEDRSSLVWQDDWLHAHPPRLVVLDMARHGGQIRRLEMRVGGTGPFECVFDSGRGMCLVQNLQSDEVDSMDLEPQDRQIEIEVLTPDFAAETECRSRSSDGRC